ncbi:CoA transferase, partial [Salmonella enterica]|nr:CoA transferase [Salmonella enterica]
MVKQQKPFAGITVLDFSRVLAGPFCSAILADQGAQIIKVEPPQGDDQRYMG